MNHSNTMERAIVFIGNYLTASFTVEDAAGEVGYPYYHLNLQFSIVLGESVGSYIRKQRLSHVAGEPIYTEKRVIGIMLDHGFESSKAFGRASKVVYHIGPAYYRKNRLSIIVNQRPEKD